MSSLYYFLMKELPVMKGTIIYGNNNNDIKNNNYVMDMSEF